MDPVDELPQSVKDEIEQAKKDNKEGAPEQEAAEEEQPQERVKVPGRRQQRDEQHKAEVQAAAERAEKAAQLAEQIRQETSEKFARLEGLLVGQQQSQQRYQEPQRQAAPEDLADKVRQLRKDADKSLADGQIGDYHDKREAADALLRERDKEDLRRQMQQQIAQSQQQVQQLPDWVRAVEAQFPDVIMHPAGKNAVAAFAQVEMAKTGTMLDPQKLMAAYGRAREELGLKKRTESQVQDRRQQLASGPSNGMRTGGSSSKDTYVNAPKNYKDIAKRAGMKPDDYLKQYAAANPNDVSVE